MARSAINITEGAGKALDTFQRTVGGTALEGQIVILGLPFVATYSVVASSISTATSAAHVLELMAGVTNHVRVESFRIKQVVSAGAAAMLSIQLLRLTTAGTGGTGVTARPYDTADTVSATAMTLAAVKGTEGVQLGQIDIPLRAAIVAAEYEYIWTTPPGVKPLIIPAGTANGLTWKIVTGVATSTISIVVTFSETAEL